jgi:uncharacterized protein (TIGR00730 family)
MVKRKPRVSVFCGSRETSPHCPFRRAAQDLGKGLAELNFDVVYGGGGSGTMGDLARAALAGGTHVSGVITTRLMNQSLDTPQGVELVIVENMHLRKQKLVEMSDFFVALPGGVGTLDEIFEVLALRAIGEVSKPLFILDINDFYREMNLFLTKISHFGLGAAPEELVSCFSSVAQLLQFLQPGVKT